jgi:hypothetical protein
MGINSEAALNRKFIEFIKLLNIYINHFPKHEKYALSNRIRCFFAWACKENEFSNIYVKNNKGVGKWQRYTVTKKL